MAANPVSADYSAITTIGAVTNPCATTSELFDHTFVEDSASAIDLYIENCKAINKIWAGSETISSEFGRLLLLGYVSAIESFFRTLLRSIINTDEKTRSDVQTFTVPFGAVLYHQKKSIAEALLEGYSFASQKDVKNAFTKFLGVQNLPEPLTAMLTEYEKVCQLRHCCVHRFGKLGVQNGMVLGLENHGRVLEKPLKLDKQKLEDIASWLMSFAKVINNQIFCILLDRSVHIKNSHRTLWSWVYAKDRAKFEQIYKLFATAKDSVPSPPAKDLYDRFKSVKQPRSARSNSGCAP